MLDYLQTRLLLQSYLSTNQIPLLLNSIASILVFIHAGVIFQSEQFSRKRTIEVAPTNHSGHPIQPVYDQTCTVPELPYPASPNAHHIGLVEAPISSNASNHLTKGRGIDSLEAHKACELASNAEYTEAAKSDNQMLNHTASPPSHYTRLAFTRQTTALGGSEVFEMPPMRAIWGGGTAHGELMV